MPATRLSFRVIGFGVISWRRAYGRWSFRDDAAALGGSNRARWTLFDAREAHATSFESHR
jgi:hypothetical protein